MTHWDDKPAAAPPACMTTEQWNREYLGNWPTPQKPVFVLMPDRIPRISLLRDYPGLRDRKIIRVGEYGDIQQANGYAGCECLIYPEPAAINGGLLREWNHITAIRGFIEYGTDDDRLCTVCGDRGQHNCPGGTP